MSSINHSSVARGSNGLQRQASWTRFRLTARGGVAILFVAMTGALSADQFEDEYVESPITNDERSHWSFQPLKRVAVPLLNDPWCRNQIDRFVAKSLGERELRPQLQATKRTLIRRLSLDLTGLPPTPAEVATFVSNPNPDVYNRLVDQLLGSTRYGERWALHWLDLARFSETDGFEHDKVRPQAWKYRDWVISALNADMPYDEFVRQQIAGDELFPEDDAASTATRFCLSGPDMPDINRADERLHTVLNEMTATVGEVILGLQVGCAQCHDHKYDPISQGDFYRLRANFEPALQLRRNKSLTVLSERPPYTSESHLMLRGDFQSPGPVVQPNVLRVVAADGFRYLPRTTINTEGRRTALADWLVSHDNPLTARVIVNRIWQHHFGAGIVQTPSDFGLMGSEPTNQLLLDWLSQFLIDHHWSLKKLHREIVTSATYRQRSFLNQDASVPERKAWNAALQLDPQALLLSRFPRWRLEGEAIRDSVLASSGQLNLKSGGPGIRPPLPKELVGTLLSSQWDVTEDRSEHARCSIYVFARRNLRFPIFEVFDRPSENASFARRSISTTAPQSLHLLNSRSSWDAAQHLSRLIRENCVLQSDQVNVAIERILGRWPTQLEREEFRRFWTRHAKLSSDPLSHLCLALFNSNEFVMVE